RGRRLMKASKRSALEKAGWTIGSADEFLDSTTRRLGDSATGPEPQPPQTTSNQQPATKPAKSK
ncbi:MAG: hypothetical protein ABI779_15030, partial [Acidobacteriota bacterium]